MQYEIQTEGGRFRGDLLTAMLFLTALGTVEVRMTWGDHRVRTGADIAHSILEREAGDTVRKAAA